MAKKAKKRKAAKKSKAAKKKTNLGPLVRKLESVIKQLSQEKATLAAPSADVLEAQICSLQDVSGILAATCTKSRPRFSVVGT